MFQACCIGCNRPEFLYWGYKNLFDHFHADLHTVILTGEGAYCLECSIAACSTELSDKLKNLVCLEFELLALESSAERLVFVECESECSGVVPAT